MKRYDYADRIIIEFDDKKRINYNHKKYGPLLEKVIVQAIRQQEKIWNPYEINQWNQKIHDTAGITKRGNKWRVTGAPRLHQKERLVDTYQEALEIRKQFVKEIEENLNL